MRFWWVNQKQTHRHEIRGGYMWCPKRNTTKDPNSAGNSPYYTMMSQVQPGDVVFSYFNGAVRAIGVATSGADTCPKPDEFVAAGFAWANEGWKVSVDYRMLKRPLVVSEHFDVIRPALPTKYSPLNRHGHGQQFYFTSVPTELANVLQSLIGADFDFAIADLGFNTRMADAKADEVQSAIEQRFDINVYEKKQLVMARRGQGIFRNNVRLVETRCRVTGVDVPQHLIASHIKPWRDSVDSEKVDGENGFLLSPHIDHLFDKGYVSFTDSGHLLISKPLQDDFSVLTKWGLDPDVYVGTFSQAQKQFLEYHRDMCLLPRAS